MKRLLLSLSLLLTAPMHADNLQDFLEQSGTAPKYEQLSVEKKSKVDDLWSKLEDIFRSTQEAFEQLERDNEESVKILKELFGVEDNGLIRFSLSVGVERADQ